MVLFCTFKSQRRNSRVCPQLQASFNWLLRIGSSDPAQELPPSRSQAPDRRGGYFIYTFVTGQEVDSRIRKHSMARQRTKRKQATLSDEHTDRKTPLLCTRKWSAFCEPVSECAIPAVSSHSTQVRIFSFSPSELLSRYYEMGDAALGSGVECYCAAPYRSFLLQ